MFAFLMDIPYLPAFLVAIFVKILDFIVKFFTARVAIAVTVVAAVTALVVLFVAVCSAAIQSIAYSLPDQYALGLSLCMPDNVSACVSAVLTVRVARYVFLWKSRVLQSFNGISN